MFLYVVIVVFDVDACDGKCDIINEYICCTDVILDGVECDG